MSVSAASLPAPEASENLRPTRNLFEPSAPLSANAVKAARLAAMAILIGWLPLPLLVLAHDRAHDLHNLPAFAADVGAHARFLVAVPLFILAEAVCARLLGEIAAHFGRSGLVAMTRRADFDRLVVSTRSLIQSRHAAAVSLILAYALVLALFAVVRADEIPQWQRLDRSVISPSPAGWWHMLVSLPLLTVLFLGWLWRLLAWTRFLLCASKLDLQIVPAHPDRSGGLAFTGLSLRAFSLAAFAMIVVVAGRVANDAFHHGVSLTAQGLLIAGSIAVVTALFVAPLLALSGVLVREWRRGVLDYGALAGVVGRQFEAKWLARRGPAPHSDALASPDFSAAADLYQSVAAVHQMRFVPLGMRNIAAFAASLLLPFLPVLLLSVPPAQVLAGLKSLLF